MGARRKIMRKCANCGKEFFQYSSLNKYCSPNCTVDAKKKYSKWNWKKESIEKVSGKNNHNYRTGDRTNGSKRSWIGNKEFWKNRDKIIDRMLEEKGYVYCEHCQKTNSPLEGHHLIYRSEKPFHEHLHDEANILILCKKCHPMFHDNKSIRNDIVEQRKLHELFGEDILDK